MNVDTRTSALLTHAGTGSAVNPSSFLRYKYTGQVMTWQQMLCMCIFYFIRARARAQARHTYINIYKVAHVRAHTHAYSPVL